MRPTDPDPGGSPTRASLRFPIRISFSVPCSLSLLALDRSLHALTHPLLCPGTDHAQAAAPAGGTAAQRPDLRSARPSSHVARRTSHVVFTMYLGCSTVHVHIRIYTRMHCRERPERRRARSNRSHMTVLLRHGPSIHRLALRDSKQPPRSPPPPQLPPTSHFSISSQPKRSSLVPSQNHERTTPFFCVSAFCSRDRARPIPSNQKTRSTICFLSLSAVPDPLDRRTHGRISLGAAPRVRN